jgi:F-type H+-transporting ATPase subunit delta
MRSHAVARRYGRAIFQLAVEEGRAAEVLAEVDALVALLAESAPLADVLYRPLYPLAERRAAFDAVARRMGLSATLGRFVEFLLQQHRMRDFPLIAGEMHRLADEAAGRVEAEVISAATLEPAHLERVRQALAANTGREVRVTPRVDPGLIGGIVARVGDLIFDGSIRTQLDQLRANLVRER